MTDNVVKKASRFNRNTIALIVSATILILLVVFNLTKENYAENNQPNTTNQESAQQVQAPEAEQNTYLVNEVVDGDTIKVFRNDQTETVRLIGIDTPETVHPSKPVECYGQEASQKLKDLLLNKQVTLEKDVSETDQYDRLLRYVYLDDQFVNYYMVVNGYANTVSYPPDIKYQEKLEQGEAIARDGDEGLWGEVCNQQQVQEPTQNESTKPAPVVEAVPIVPSNNQYMMKVLNIIYIPVKKGGLVDLGETGTLPFEDASALQNHIRQTTELSLEKLTQASGYHQYQNSASEPSLTYSLIKTKVYDESLPKGLAVPWSEIAHRPDYIKILEREDICNYVDEHKIKEIWLWGYHTNKIEPVESDMSMGLSIKNYWNHDKYGDISNSEMTNDLPICQNTYVLFNLNYGRGVGEVLENHTHHIERVMGYIDAEMWGKFVGICGAQEYYACGWTHYPPNVMQYCSEHDYDWNNKVSVLSNCMDWNPDGSGRKEQISCHTWGGNNCEDDSGVSFKVWWMQNIPGTHNEITYNGQKLINWWSAIGDFDEVINRKSLRM